MDRDGAVPVRSFDPLDWTVAAIFMGFLGLECALAIAFQPFGSAVIPFWVSAMLASMFALGGLVWIAGHHQRGFRFGWPEMGALGATLLVAGAGLAGVIYDLVFGAVVAMGYLLVFAGGYLVYRSESFKYHAEPERTGDSLLLEGRPLTVEELRRIDIFAEFELDDLKRMAAVGRKHHFPIGTTLAMRGDQGRYVFGILQGQVELYVPSAVGETTVRVAGEGESLPLAALVGRGELITCARTMTDTEACVFRVGDLRTEGGLSPQMEAALYRAVAGTLASRYRVTLSRLTTTMHEALKQPEMWANL